MQIAAAACRHNAFALKLLERPLLRHPMAAPASLITASRRCQFRGDAEKCRMACTAARTSLIVLCSPCCKTWQNCTTHRRGLHHDASTSASFGVERGSKPRANSFEKPGEDPVSPSSTAGAKREGSASLFLASKNRGGRRSSKRPHHGALFLHRDVSLIWKTHERLAD